VAGDGHAFHVVPGRLLRHRHRQGTRVSSFRSSAPHISAFTWKSAFSESDDKAQGALDALVAENSEAALRDAATVFGSALRLLFAQNTIHIVSGSTLHM
jgi:hypothetical protein